VGTDEKLYLQLWGALCYTGCVPQYLYFGGGFYMDNTQVMLNLLLKKYCVQPIGRGYTECIVNTDNVFAFINELSIIRINIKSITWWCHCNSYNEGKNPKGEDRMPFA
jgi:hypothetical protein